MAKKRIAMRDHSAEGNLFARRCVIAVIFTMVLISFVLSNLYSLQVTQFNEYQIRADGNRIKVNPVAPNRGLIYDRNMRIIAENRPIFNLELNVAEIEDREQTIQQLAELLQLTENELTRFTDNLAKRRRFQPVEVLFDISKERVAKFSARQHEFPGVSVQARLSRYYPYGKALTHVLGYVAKINSQDLNLVTSWGAQSNYAATRHIGKQGIERFYEERLHGKVGYEHIEVDSKGRALRTLEEELPIPGEDIILSIDIDLQLYIQDILKDKKGSVVVMDPNNGQVLAMYSNPSYDPNLFVNGISQREYSKLIENKDRPLLNRAVQGQYPPASLVKPHLALLGLEYGKIDENTTIKDEGFYQLDNVDHVWRDWLRRGHGNVDVKRSVEVSCDTFFYDLAYRLGIDSIHDYMHKFGFGEYTGIDLLEESDGNMPSRGWKKARYNQPWYIGDTISVGIGQGYWTATPVQLLDSLNTIINEGQRIQPRIYLGVNVASQAVIEPPSMMRPIEVLDNDNWRIIKESLYNTVNKPHGTAYKAYQNTAYESAGKTGTAQLFTVAQDEEYDDLIIADYLKDNAMYFGYAPSDNPQISVMVALENAGGGGSNAAPIARQVMDYVLSPSNVTLSAGGQ